jgi:TPR repeat protein
MRELGQVFEKGGLREGEYGPFIKLVEVDLIKALALYEKAAELNDQLTLNYLGAYHFNVTRDLNKAVKLFKKASENGKCSRALNNLGLCYEIGAGDLA